MKHTREHPKRGLPERMSLAATAFMALLALLPTAGFGADVQSAPPAGAKPGEKIIWVGQGADDKWSPTANWQPARVPGAADDVVIDGASARNTRWDGEQHIASLTVTPAYKGQLIFAGHGAIEGDVVLSGRVHTFAFQNCRIGNCDASGGEAVIATDRCTDAGGNRNLKFVP